MMKLERKTLKSIFIIAVVTSLVLSFSVIIPVYIVKIEVANSFIVLWINMFIRYFILWFVDFNLLLHFGSKKWIKNWLRIILSTCIVLMLDYFASMLFGNIYPVQNISKLELFYGRFFLLLIFSIIVYIITDLILSKEIEINNQKEIAELKYKNLESEYNLLRSQINPHFIFNALNISKSLIKDSPEEAEKYIIDLSDFIRASVPTNKKTSTISEEIEICNKFIELQKVRFGDSFVFSFDIDKNYLRWHIPFFTLLTLLENAFKHNVFTRNEPLTIKIYNEGEYIVTENNINLKKAVNSMQTGLNNLNTRSKIISGNLIDIINESDKFKVKVKMVNFLSEKK